MTQEDTKQEKMDSLVSDMLADEETKKEYEKALTQDEDEVEYETENDITDFLESLASDDVTN